ncbi:MAG TPA: peptidase [Clostridiales bacterium]|nr:peptidase [Clostridiales bacterium]
MLFYILYYGTFIILIPGIILAFIAQILVKTTFSKYSKRYASSGITADEASRKMLRDHNCVSVDVQPISGSLTDNYNPKTDVLSLSDSVYSSSSIAALGVAAHECGHACQQYENSSLLKLRSFLVPVTNIGSRLAVPVAIVGLILEWIMAGTQNFGSYVLAFGILLYSLSTIFALVTLPVEIGASSRAMKMLKEENFLEGKELSGARRVLTAAALTYVASLVVSFLYLLRFLILISSSRKRK